MQRILALGGGGFLMEDAASPIDEYIANLAGKPRPKICFLSTASGDHPEHIDKFYAAYGKLGCQPSHIAFFRKPGNGSIALSDLDAGVLGQDIIFVGGGNTKSALAVWREWHLDSIFRRALDSGVVLSGMSAGAMCWYESGLTDSYWGSGYQPLACLGLLPGACGVHYHSDGQRQSRLAEALLAGAIPAAVAIDDYAGVLYQDGAIAQVVSWRPGATAYSVAIRNGSVAETPYECTSIAPRGV
jgi:dipeptidase E